MFLFKPVFLEYDWLVRALNWFPEMSTSKMCLSGVFFLFVCFCILYICKFFVQVLYLHRSTFVVTDFELRFRGNKTI